MKQQSLTMSFLFFFLSFFPCHSTSLPSIRFHFLAFPFIPFHVLPFTLVSLVGHAPPRHQHCTSYSRKEKRIRFILKFGSVFVSAIRFCGVSAGGSQNLRRFWVGFCGNSAGVSASFGRLGCFVSAAFLRVTFLDWDRFLDGKPNGWTQEVTLAAEIRFCRKF